MVNNDPALVKRLRRLRDDWHESDPAIAVAEHREVIEQSVSEGILTEETGEILGEMAEGLEDEATSDERRRRRFVETMRNMPRAVVGWLWKHKWKLVTLGGSAIGGVKYAATSLDGAAHWLVTHADWLQRVFADDPHVLKLIKNCSTSQRDCLPQLTRPGIDHSPQRTKAWAPMPAAPSIGIAARLSRSSTRGLPCSNPFVIKASLSGRS
jgi:hypothetical protein